MANMQINPLTGKLDLIGNSLTEDEIAALCPLDVEGVELPNATPLSTIKHIPMTAGEIEALTPFEESLTPPAESSVREVYFSLENGIYNAETKQIVWYAGNGILRLTQSKGYGVTAVNPNYIFSPRAYKGHILFFETLVVGAYISKIEIKYSGQYQGNTMVAGIETDTSDNVLQSTDLIDVVWASENDGTHVIQDKNGQGMTKIYIQNSSTETTVQLRITNIAVTYKIMTD